MQATLSRPVAITRRSNPRRIRRLVVAWTTRGRGALVNLGAQARRPVLTIGSMAAGCHAAWQIWHPLGWAALAVAGLWLERITGPEDET